MLSSGDVIKMNMLVGRARSEHDDGHKQYQYAGGHMQYNHNTVLCIYSNDVCTEYRRQNICNADYTCT